MTTPELTLAITTRDRIDLIDETLAAVADQTWDGDWDVLVIDNGSSDGTADRVRSWLDRMPVPARLVTADERHNPSYSRNAAVANTEARSVAFVDDDDVIGDGWVAAIGDALREHEFVGSRMEYRRLNRGALADAVPFQSARLGRHFGVPIVDSAGSGCRRTLWARVGGSDEAFRNSQDVDFSLRVAQHTDVTPHFCEDAVYHARRRAGFVSSYRRGVRRGRAEVQLHETHGARIGANADNLVIAVARWVRLAGQSTWLFSTSRRMIWAENAGRRVGRLRGSIDRRVWFP